MREKDKRALYLIAFAALALVTLISWDRLKSAFFSPGGIMLRALPSADASEAEDEDRGNTIQFDVLEIDEDVDRGILFELLDSPGESDLSLSGEEPRVLILHTHTTEAYLQTMETDWRTRDEQNNIVAAGRELARLLAEEYGISVIHDTTNHEPPRLGTSYERSIKTMEYYREKYPSINLFIDIHRDSYILGGDDGGLRRRQRRGHGQRGKAARACVAGTGKERPARAFPVKPITSRNYAIALRSQLPERDQPETDKADTVKTGRYNQHVGDCILVEMGTTRTRWRKSANCSLIRGGHRAS